MRLRLLSVLLALLAFAAACTTDCEVICDKVAECTGRDDEDSRTLCAEQCERDVAEDRRADGAAACASCLSSHACEELWPEGAEGACDADC